MYQKFFPHGSEYRIQSNDISTETKAQYGKIFYLLATVTPTRIYKDKRNVIQKVVLFSDSSLYAHYVFKAFDVNCNGAITFRVSFRINLSFSQFLYQIKKIPSSETHLKKINHRRLREAGVCIKETGVAGPRKANILWKSKCEALFHFQRLTEKFPLRLGFWAGGMWSFNLNQQREFNFSMNVSFPGETLDGPT